MTDMRHHRGPAPEDEALFAPGQWPALLEAGRDLFWLLNRGYPKASANELVGNRYDLARRQRIAVGRSVCSARQLERRLQHEVRELRDRELWIDGFNVLTGLECALAGGVILAGFDGCCRDVAGIHGSYHIVAETANAIALVGDLANRLGATCCHWRLDRPVSNSGRLKMLLLETAANNQWDWRVDLDFNPDKILSECKHVVASSDSLILDQCQSWFNLAGQIVASRTPKINLVSFRGE